MSLHVAFCLDEIDCELEADHSLDEQDRICLKRHVAEMRLVLEAARTRRNGLTHARDQAQDDLTLIRGIGAAERDALSQAGVVCFDTIADWRLADIQAITAFGIDPRRISQENWIEQAAILSAGNMTSYAQGVQVPELGRDTTSHGADWLSELTRTLSERLSAAKEPMDNATAQPADPLDIFANAETAAPMSQASKDGFAARCDAKGPPPLPSTNDRWRMEKAIATGALGAIGLFGALQFCNVGPLIALGQQSLAL